MNNLERSSTSASASPWPWIIFILLVPILLLSLYGQVVFSAPFVEEDFVWMSVGKIGAEWLPYMDHIDELFQKPVMRVVADKRPGHWIFQVGISLLLGDSEPAQFLALLFLLGLNGILLAYLVSLMGYDNKIAFGAGLLFLLHPHLSGSIATIAQAGANLGFFWVLVAAISLVQSKRKNRFVMYLPLFCSVFLAYSTHSVGLVALPLLLFVDIATLPKGWGPNQMTGLVFRTTLVFSTLMVFAVAWYPVDGARELIQVVAAIKLVKPIVFALGQSFSRLLLPFIVFPGSESDLFGMNVSRLVLFAIPVVLGLCLAAIYDDKRRLPAVGLIFFGVLFQTPAMLAAPVTSPAMGAAFLAPAAGLAILLSEIVFRLRPRALSFIALFAILCLFLSGSILGARNWARQGNDVKNLASEIRAVTKQLGDSVEVYLVAGGEGSQHLPAAHLDFVRRYDTQSRLRFSFLEMGIVFPESKSYAAEQAPVGTTLLPLNPSPIFLGMGKDGHLIDLTKTIQSKIKLANEVIHKEQHLPPRWLMGPEARIDEWDVGAGCKDQAVVEDPSQITWYLEGNIRYLHPEAGQLLY